jgi:hypothetical protein
MLASFVPWMSLKDFPDTPRLPIAAANLVVLGLSVMALVFFYSGRIRQAALTMGLGTFAIIVVIYGCFLPHAEYLQLSRRVGQDLRDLHVTGVDQARMLDYMEPSLAFYQGGTIREAGPIGFHMKFFDQMPEWLVITGDLWDKASPELKGHFQIIKTHRGWAYADQNRVVEVMIVRKK